MCRNNGGNGRNSMKGSKRRLPQSILSSTARRSRPQQNSWQQLQGSSPGAHPEIRQSRDLSHTPSQALGRRQADWPAHMMRLAFGTNADIAASIRPAGLANAPLVIARGGVAHLGTVFTFESQDFFCPEPDTADVTTGPHARSDPRAPDLRPTSGPHAQTRLRADSDHELAQANLEWSTRRADAAISERRGCNRTEEAVQSEWSKRERPDTDVDVSINTSTFACPITQEVMKDPVIAADGFSYERKSIERWFEMGHTTSPVTNKNLEHLFLTTNHSLRKAIDDVSKSSGGLP